MTSIKSSMAKKILASTAGALVLGMSTLAVPGIAAAASGPATGRVTVNDLAVRSAPTTKSAPVTQVDKGFKFQVRCKVSGPSVGGNTTWLAVGPDVDKWVSDNYVKTRGYVPECGMSESVEGATTGYPILNSFAGPSIKNNSVYEYEPATMVELRCYVSNAESSGSTQWYYGAEGDWLPGSYVELPEGAEVEIC